MIEMTFIDGPLDGTQELEPAQIRATLYVPDQPNGYYQLAKRDEEGEQLLSVNIMQLSSAEISERYRYFWVTKESRGTTANI